MLRLILEEYDYYKNVIINITFILIAFLLVTYLDVKFYNIIPAQMLILMVATFSAAFIGEKRRILQLRDRYHLLLPVKIFYIAVTRMIYPLGIWIIYLGIFLIMTAFYYMIASEPIPVPSLVQLLTFNGYILIINSTYLISRDLSIDTKSKFAKHSIVVTRNLMPFIAMAPFYILMNVLGAFGRDTSLQKFLLNISESYLFAILLNLFGIVLSILGIYIFKIRSSYVNS